MMRESFVVVVAFEKRGLYTLYTERYNIILMTYD